MRTYFDCIPCFLRQALDAVRLVTDEQTVQEQLLREVLRAASEMDLSQSPPAMGQYIHRLIRQLTGNNDPYRRIKDRMNRWAVRLYPRLKSRLEDSSDPLGSAIRMAIAGNVMDIAVVSDITEADVLRAVDGAMRETLDASIEEFSEAVSAATRILYLADNAGEIVFDRLLIEQMPRGKLTLAVRGSAVINDATMADAEAAGLIELVEVIDNGSDAPGTILHQCSESFRRRFDSADLIIAKGQGNYETLSDVEKDIFFALKVKCPVIAAEMGCSVGHMVLRRSAWSTAAAGRD